MRLAYQFQGQTVKGQGWRWSGHAVSAEPGGHTASYNYGKNRSRIRNPDMIESIYVEMGSQVENKNQNSTLSAKAKFRPISVGYLID